MREKMYINEPIVGDTICGIIQFMIVDDVQIREVFVCQIANLVPFDIWRISTMNTF